MTPFDFVNQILQGKKQLIVDKETESEYVPFIVNRSLSYHKDCVMIANEMNMRSGLENKMQNDFYLNTIRSWKRPFEKWIKPEKYEDIEYVSQYYGRSKKQAKESIKLLSKEDISEIRERCDVGGVSGKKRNT